MRAWSVFSRLYRDRAGATAVEFAIIANVFIMFVVGIGYIGIMLFNNASLGWAVHDAARLVAINPSVTQDEIAAAVNNRLSQDGLSTASVTYDVSTINSIETAHILASYAQAYTIPFIPTFHMTFRSETYVPIKT